MIDLGKTVYIGNPRHTTKITPKTFKKWNDAGLKLFRINKAGELQIARGKSYDVIVSKDFAHVSIRAV